MVIHIVRNRDKDQVLWYCVEASHYTFTPLFWSGPDSVQCEYTIRNNGRYFVEANVENVWLVYNIHNILNTTNIKVLCTHLLLFLIFEQLTMV